MDDSVFVSFLISVPRGIQHLFFSCCNCPPITGREIFGGLHSHGEEPLVMEILDLLFLENIRTETL